MPSSGKAGCGESRPSGLEEGSRKPGSLDVHRTASRRIGPYDQTSRKTPKAPSFYSYTIIAVDTHVTEAPDLWTSRVPARMRDAVPRVDPTPRGASGGSWGIGASRARG